MNGWTSFLLLAGAAGAGTWYVARAWRPAGAAVLLAVLAAAAGYAWQGHPLLAGAAGRSQAAQAGGADLFMAERPRWLEQVGYDAQTLDTADALIRRGDTDYAVGIVRGALGRAPRDPVLWIALGHALARYADGAVTPAARFAFDRAAALWPDSPAPRFFLALAYADAGDTDRAEQTLRALLAGSPPRADWRGRAAFVLSVLRQADAATQARER